MGNPIQLENEKPGTRDWQLQKIDLEGSSRFRHPAIEGYASPQFTRAGETVEFKVSTRPASRFTLEIFRLGYYQGQGATQVLSLGPFEGRLQPEPKTGEGLAAACAWTGSHSLKIPADWTSGVYLGKLRAEPSGFESALVFLVRDGRKADFNFQCATHTWAAYNRWPEAGSLYDKDGKFWWWGPGTAVGWERPYGFPGSEVFLPPTSLGAGEFPLWEFPLAFWMEKEGYDVTYTGNQDTHLDPAGLLRTKTFLSVGHDEYWTPEMLANLQAAVDQGLNAAFLCGNSLYGSVEYGTEMGSFTRTGLFCPAEEGIVAMFPEVLGLKTFAPDAAQVMGVRSTSPVVGLGPWTCVKPDHWLFAGTEMAKGEGIPGLVGWEFHGRAWPHPDLEVVAEGPVDSGQARGRFQSVLFPGPRGNWIFNAATIWWAQGLSSPPGHALPTRYGGQPTGLQGPDERVQKITRNLFDRMK